MEQEIKSEKIQCPVCFEKECYKESFKDVESYLCMGCGFTTTNKHIAGSIELRQWEMTTATLIKKAKFVDPETNLVWYPSVLNFPTKGIVFPDGKNEYEWGWRAASVIEVSEADREKYPIPGKKGEYYKSRVDMASSKLFQRGEFKQACESVGILVAEEQSNGN